MMRVDRETVLAHLCAEDVVRHLAIEGTWRGRWLRSRRCGVTDHSSDAFGISRDGFWHCWSCGDGGDLLSLIATAERLDINADFPRVLALAAGLAGVDSTDDFGAISAPVRRERPPLPTLPPLGQRIAIAKKRAAWAWGRLVRREEVPGAALSGSDGYLRTARGLDISIVRSREEIREAPLRCTPEECAKSEELQRLSRTFAVPGVALPIRAVDDGRLVDIRIRRYQPRDGQPKIMGMAGGITVAPAESGKPRRLVGCYGHPESLDADMVVVVEGAFDYLTALEVWPHAAVLGATEAGSLALVAAHAARELAWRDQKSRLLIVEQRDPPRTLADGRQVPGAADASVNEDPNAATKVAVRILGPRRVGWLFCEGAGDEGIKDLNDLLIAFGAHADEVAKMVRWEKEIGQ